MAPKKTTRPNTPKRQKTPPDPTSRLKSALQEAHRFKAILKPGDATDLAQAVILQGILSGDIISASIMTRLKLQSENLRLRARLQVQKLRESEAKERLMREQTRKLRTPQSHEAAMAAIREIYGLPPKPPNEPHTLPQDASPTTP